MTTNNHIVRSDEMVDLSTDISPMVEQLARITEMEPQARQSAEEIADILGDWYLGAMEHGDEAFADALVLIANRANQISDTVQNQSAFIGALVEMAHVLTEQRDGAFEELGQIDEAIENHWMTKHPKIRNLHEDISETVVSDFWEGMPYALAGALGEPWDFSDASDLHHALTAEIDDVFEEDAGYNAEELQAFRNQLHAMIRNLTRRDQ